MAKITFVSCVISTLTKCQTFMEVFYINICGLISRDKFLYETRVLDNTYLRFKVKLPISDHNAEITAGGLKITLGGPVSLDAPVERFMYTKRVLYHI